MITDETAVKRSRLLDRHLAGQGIADDGNGRIVRRQQCDRLPLSFTEERLWFLDQLVPGSSFYVETAALPVNGPLNRLALERSVNAVVIRHEALRTSFVVADGEPMRRIAPSLHIPLPLIDLAMRPAKEQSAAIARLAAEESGRPFDLSTGPLLRTTLVRLGPAAHVLLLIVHHIVSDGWSMQVFSNEVSTLYAALVHGQPLRLAELPIQYADYALWQRSRVASGALAAHREYWLQQLSGLSEIALLTDHPRPAVLTYRGDSVDVRIPRGLSDDVKQFSRREGVTTFMTGLAAFVALLARYSDQTDLPIGVPVAGRQHAELEPLIGCFLNTIVLRIDASGDPSFRELLHRVQSVALAGYDRQEFPFDSLVHDLHPGRDLGRNPLFQVMFQYFAPPGAASATVSADTVPIEHATAIVDLFCHVWDSDLGLRGRIDFSTELFERATIGAMATHLLVALRAAIRDPELRLSQVPLLTGGERANLLGLSRGVARSFGSASRIDTLFERQAAQTPNAVALFSDEGAVTYAELNRAANRIAAVLRSEGGVGPNSVVGVCLERSAELVAVLLGILKAGAAWVALDTTYPRQLLAHIADDAGAVVVVTRSDVRDRLLDQDRPTLCLDTDRALLDAAPEHNAASGGLPSALAYLIYTSGSTGRPKGVMADHVATFNRFCWMWEEFPFARDEVTVQRTAVGFVDSVWEIFGPLLAGVPSVILSDEMVRDPKQFVDRLASHRVTRVLVVPSLLKALLDSGQEIGLRLPKLKLWFTSGEALPSDLAHRFLEYVSDGRLVNLYGSSEVAGDVTSAVVESRGRGAPAAIGRPISNTAAYVLDPRGQLVPVGVAGRLFIAGPNVAHGYHRQPRLTAERFIPDPFSPIPGARMYDMGDRVRWTPSDQLEYLGRFDHQVKVRGYRVETGGLQTILEEHPGVRSAVVTTATGSDGAIELRAFYVPNSDEVESAELRAYLRTKVPDYMVPSAIVPIETLPLKPNGKVDRDVLASLHAVAVDEAKFVAPRSEIEDRLAGIWQDLLRLDRVGVHDNFFDIGGHSLLATRLVSRVREQLAIELPLQRVFELPTIAQLAEVAGELMITDLDHMTDHAALDT